MVAWLYLVLCSLPLWLAPRAFDARLWAVIATPMAIGWRQPDAPLGVLFTPGGAFWAAVCIGVAWFLSERVLSGRWRARGPITGALAALWFGFWAGDADYAFEVSGMLAIAWLALAIPWAALRLIALAVRRLRSRAGP